MKTKKFRRIPAILGITLLVAAVALITVALALPSGAEPSLTDQTKITFYGVDKPQNGTPKLYYVDVANLEDDGDTNNVLGMGQDSKFGKATVDSAGADQGIYVLSSLPKNVMGKSYFSFYTYEEQPNVVVILGCGDGFSETSFSPKNSIVLEPKNGKYTINASTVAQIPGVSEEEVDNLYVKAVYAYPVTLPASSNDFDITLVGEKARLSDVQRVIDYENGEEFQYSFNVTSRLPGKTPVVGVEHDGQYTSLQAKNGAYTLDDSILRAKNVKVLVSLRDPVTVTYTDGVGSRYTVTAADDTINAYQLTYGVDKFTVTINGGSTVSSVYTVTKVTALDADGNALTVNGPEGFGNGTYTISAEGGITSNVTVIVTTTEEAKKFNVTVNGSFPANVNVTGLNESEATKVSYGNTLTFSVTPHAGYTQPVVTYKVGDSGNEITLAPNGTTYSIPNVTDNITVTINATEKIKFNVSKNLPTGVDSVKLTVSEEDIEANGKIAYTEAVVKVILTLKDGYTNATPHMTVNGSTVELDGTGKTRTGSFTGVTSDLAIVVTDVVINTYTVTDGNNSRVKNYTLTFTSGNTFTHGSAANVTFTVTPALGYTVTKVSVNDGQNTVLEGNSSTGYTYTGTPNKDVTIEVTVVASFEATLSANYVDGKIVWSAILTFKGGLAKTTYTVVGVGLFFGKEEATISNPEDYRTNSYVGNFSNNDNGYIFVNGENADNATVAYFCHTDGGEYNDSEYSFDYRIKDIESAARSAVLYFEIEIDGQTMTIFTNVATYSGN